MEAATQQRFQLDVAAPDTLVATGELSFDTAATALLAIQSALGNGGIKRLDLAKLSRSDSAGLACVLAVAAEARRSGRALEVTHMPTGMLALAQVCEVDRLIC
ncbi:STAS domain-containing protein [Rhodanobacter sp. AS-Z3]|uniref:STAS domain-containing protein n=1 Tax=Rhodanobacter sp. AS-Z3 TaxID=3031330 RepID=UPI002479BAF8|nr:STAS domain-containing protein [Rhodanobacter sp. AS-Z3]WEN16820.1 STAS domain-containing protein [Rhodanobacter sp. AS-Z3]